MANIVDEVAEDCAVNERQEQVVLRQEQLVGVAKTPSWNNMKLPRSDPFDIESRCIPGHQGPAPQVAKHCLQPSFYS